MKEHINQGQEDNTQSNCRGEGHANNSKHSGDTDGRSGVQGLPQNKTQQKRVGDVAQL